MFHVFPDSLTATKESSASGKARDKVFVINLGIKKNAAEWHARGKTRGWGHRRYPGMVENGVKKEDWETSPPAVHHSGRVRELLGLNWPIPEEQKEQPATAIEK